MTIKTLIINTAKLVAEIKIINHGSIRCLHSDDTVRSIEQVEACDEVETGIIGDDELAQDLNDLAGDGDRIANLDFDAVRKLEDAFLGDDLEDYIDQDKEDELTELDNLIDLARELV